MALALNFKRAYRGNGPGRGIGQDEALRAATSIERPREWLPPSEMLSAADVTNARDPG
jgi:hypothetical protein